MGIFFIDSVYQIFLLGSGKVPRVTKLTQFVKAHCPLPILPEGEVLILHGADLVDDNLGEDILSNVLGVEHAHEAVAELLLDLQQGM